MLQSFCDTNSSFPVTVSVLRERRRLVTKISLMYVMSNEAAAEQALGQLLKLLQA